MDDNLTTLIGSVMLAPVLTLMLFGIVRSTKDTYGWKWLTFLIACAMWVCVGLYLVTS